MENSLPLFTVQKAAEFLGVNAGTIRRWAHNQQLNGTKIGIRGDWRFTKDELLKMAKSNHESHSLHGELPMGEAEHFVFFYENDESLINSVNEFLSKGDSVIVAAMHEHRAKLDESLKEHRLDMATGTSQGQYISFDVIEILPKFMVNGLPDPKRFFDLMERVVIQASSDGRRVRIFGEIVAYLWAEGNHGGAIRLEQLWNELQKKYSFSLFCAYPMHGFNENTHTTPFNDICDLHSKVLPAESYSKLDSTDARLREIAILQQKANSLEVEIERRIKLEKQKDEFMGIVSHELKTPVTSLKAFTQVLKSKFQKEGNLKSAEYLAKMDTQINKLTGLIEDLLDVTKVQGGKFQFHESYFHFDEVVDEVIEEVQRTTEKHTIIKKGSARKKIFGDRDRIGQVITNLLTNAIKYSPNANTIIVKLSADKNELVFSVEDFGVGISKNEQSHLFERFYRASGVQQETYPGLGLGLYISAQIVQRHGGRIWVESKKNEGSTFSFTLPVKNKK